jgi:hypothetical protein
MSRHASGDPRQDGRWGVLAVVHQAVTVAAAASAAPDTSSVFDTAPLVSAHWRGIRVS